MTLTAISQDGLRAAILRRTYELLCSTGIPAADIPAYPLFIEHQEGTCTNTSNWSLARFSSGVSDDAWNLLNQAADEMAKLYRLDLPYPGASATDWM